MTTITSDTLLLDTDRHARVTAGPGAGKTYWLAEHTKNVIRRSKKLHSHARIGVISYTNVAADELKQKLGNDADRADTGPGPVQCRVRDPLVRVSASACMVRERSPV